jgi:hypothetical protein
MAGIEFMKDTCTSTTKLVWAHTAFMDVKLGNKDEGEWRWDEERKCLLLSIGSVDVLALLGVRAGGTPKINDNGIARLLYVVKGGLKPPLTWEMPLQ